MAFRGYWLTKYPALSHAGFWSKAATLLEQAVPGGAATMRWKRMHVYNL